MPIYENEAKALFKEAVVAALSDIGEFILDESNKVAPLEDGALINSGAVVVNDTEFTVSVSYDTPYALKQHEDLELHHKNGRQAKFLTGTVDANRKRIREYAEQKLKAAFK